MVNNTDRQESYSGLSRYQELKIKAAASLAVLGVAAVGVLGLDAVIGRPSHDLPARARAIVIREAVLRSIGNPSLSPEDRFRNQFLWRQPLEVDVGTGGRGLWGAFTAKGVPIITGTECLTRTPYDTEARGISSTQPGGIVGIGPGGYPIIISGFSSNDTEAPQATIHASDPSHFIVNPSDKSKPTLNFSVAPNGVLVPDPATKELLSQPPYLCGATAGMPVLEYHDGKPSLVDTITQN